MTYLHGINLIKSSAPGAHGGNLDLEAKRAFRTRQLEVSHANPKGWTWLRRTSWVRNSGGYKAGGITVAQNSTAVTGVSTTFPSPCAGWIIGATRQGEETYRIAARGGDTALTLDRPYEGESASELGYKMHDPYCRAPSDLYAWEAVTLEADGRTLHHEPMGYVRGVWPKEIGFGGGRITTLGQPSTRTGYKVGTVTVAKGSPAVTGAATTFPEWSPNHHFRLGDENVLYKILSRDSDTALTLDRPYGGFQPGATKAYHIDPPGAIQVEVICPREDQYALKIDYFCEPQHLENDADAVEGPESYVNIIVDLASADVLMAQIDPSRMTQDMTAGLLNKAKMYHSRGMASLNSMLGSSAPLPEQDAVVRDIRYEGGRIYV